MLPNGLGSNWQSKSPTKGLVWFGLIIPQAYIEKPWKAKKPNQSNPYRTPSTICMIDWFIIGIMMGNVCFGDDFWSNAREIGVPVTTVSKINFHVFKYESNSVNGIK